MVSIYEHSDYSRHGAAQRYPQLLYMSSVINITDDNLITRLFSLSNNWITNEHHSSITGAWAITGLSDASVSGILEKKAWDLLPTDFPQRMEFAHFVMDKANANNNFSRNIVYIAETKFTGRV